MSIGAGGPIPLTNRYTGIPATPIIPDDNGTVTHIYWKDSVVPYDTFGSQGQWASSPGCTFKPADALLGLPAGCAFSFNRFVGPTTLWNFTTDFSGCFLAAIPASAGSVILGSTNTGGDGWFINDNSALINGNGSLAIAVTDAGAMSTTGLNVVCFGWVQSTNTYWLGINGRPPVSGVRTTTISSSQAQLGGNLGGNSFGGVLYEVMISKSTPTLQRFDSITRAVYQKFGMQGA